MPCRANPARAAPHGGNAGFRETVSRRRLIAAAQRPIWPVFGVCAPGKRRLPAFRDARMRMAQCHLAFLR
jgi:hypothetical protein